MWGSNFGDWGNSFCGYGSSFGHGPLFIGWFVPLLFWGVIAYLAYSVIRSLFSNKITQHNDNALEILRNRFASGEINEQEYIAQKVVLGKR